jgi:hypothetical protein
LFYEQDFDQGKRPSRELYLATLQEAAGRPQDALRTFQSLRSGLTSNASGGLTSVVDASIARLSRQPTPSSKTR